MKVKIREYTKSDANDIKKIFAQFVKYHSELDDSFKKVKEHTEMFIEYVESNLSNDKHHCAVAELNGKVIGYYVSKIEEKPPVYLVPTYGYIDNICVLEEYQKKGVGSLLVKDTKKWFKKKNISRIECFAVISNPKSTSFWRKMRFNPFIEQMYFNLGKGI